MEEWIDPGGVGVAAVRRSQGDAITWLPEALVTAARELELDEAELALGVELRRELDEALDLEGWIGLVAAARLARSRGSTRLDLGAPIRATLDDLGLGAAEEALATRLREHPEAFAPIVAPAGAAHAPLVVDRAYLYHQQTWELERRVAAAIAARVQTDLEFGAPSVVSPIVLSDEQTRAVEVASRCPLALVTGGPGTGKTTIVVAILQTLAETGEAMEDIALAAPTGKAADRLRSSVERPLGEASLAAPASSTLHRLLGYSPRGEFRHHEGNPLSAKVVLVDESSMIDLAMMDRLLRAMRPEARLILLGDADQLPSVEAGAVFRDLCDACSERYPDRVARLTKSYRMDPNDPSGRAVLLAARAVHTGESPNIVRRQSAPELQFERVEGLTSHRLDAFLDRWWTLVAADPALARRPYRASLEAHEALDALFASVERSRLLTLTRGRSTGSVAINESLHRRARSGPSLAFGEPVLVRRNDYERGLFNGDQGIVLGVGGRPSVVFRRDAGFVAFPLDAVHGLIELAYAVTVHKAQGSEHDRVALVLPNEPIPLLTREIVYTAMTRARQGVVIVGDPALLDVAIGRPLQRSSGLASRI